MDTYLRILGFVKPYWRKIVITFLFTVLYAVLSGVSVYLTIPLLDTLFQESSMKQQVTTTTVSPATGIVPGWLQNIKEDVVNAFNNFVLSGDKMEILFRISLLIIIAFFLKNVFGYLQANYMAYVEYASMKDLRDKAYEHLNKLPMSFFKKERVGNLISRFTNDVQIIQASISATFSNLIKEPLTILVFLTIALSISWKLTLWALIVAPVSTFFIILIGRKLRKQTGILQSKLADITSILQETISGVKVVKAFGMENYENEKFKDETNKYFKIALKIIRIRNSSSPITEFLGVIVGAVLLYYGGILVLKEGTLSASEFMGFLFAIFQMIPPIKELGSVNNRIQEASAAADRIFSIMDIEPGIIDRGGSIELKEFKDNIIFENVSFYYDDSNEIILNDVSFEVKRGEILALVGPSGGGKSTLVDLVPRFYDPTAGRILIDNYDIKDVKIDSLRRMMGIVTQETFLFNGTVRQNIAYGLDDYPMEKIEQVAKTANAHDFIIQMPKGYNTIVGERGVKLSGGQRQRLTIARALLKNPAIMIFDEATSSLDNESEILVQEAIERLMINRTTFVIAHRLSTIRNATKILVIDKGTIIQMGTHEELVRDDNGLYKKLYEMQFREPVSNL
ncbi:putative multidrug export ATP-binding/permease protein [bacterium BMS3Abin03]|nr:putative multidrug export ATP-binding/permease protein [bacterium BMS3Abin03]